MRIFSLHKSKSKKQVLEKTPKLAAKKFLEKRKVGTVIYLHEHPSGKIHGPYRKDNDKKIMKGGLDVFDFRVDRPQNNQIIYPPCLRGTNQLIIKRPRVGFLSNEPRIFFGDNHKIDKENNHYYTYVCKNKDYDINNLILFRKLEDSDGQSPPQIRELTLEEVKRIPPQILLGFYTQYIKRCKEDFPERREIVFRLMYMRRLFFYLFYHILPVIGKYILEKIFGKINIKKLNMNMIETNHNTMKKDNEFKHFMNIIKFLIRVKVEAVVDEIKFICNLNPEEYEKLKKEINRILQNFSQLSPLEKIINIQQSIIQSENPVLINAVENLSSSASAGVNPIGFGNQFHSQPMPPYNRDHVINLTGEIPQPRRRGPIIQAHNSSSTITGVGPMEVVEFIGLVISIPFRIIFSFMQLAG
jgi:hypothetical protein